MTTNSLEFVPIRTLARKLHVSDRTIRRWVGDKKLPEPHRVGRIPMWRASEVDRWITAGGQPPATPPTQPSAAAGGAA
jgi:excisionase family DNA binding protein